ncbi:MAG: RadC family protein [Candidatus Methylomirabilales bacterium]
MRRPAVPIRKWPVAERPRERLLRDGPAALTDGELLAILCRTGRAGTSALTLARQLLTRFGSLRGLDAAEAQALREISGLGPAKIAQLKAAFEVGRRAQSEQKRPKGAATSSRAVYAFLRPLLRDRPREAFVVLLLNRRNAILDVVTVSEGSLAESPVYPREVLAVAQRGNAAALIVAHNHPSGHPAPSPEDEAVTQELLYAGRLLQLPVLDHLIVGETEYFSFADAGLIAQYNAAFDRHWPRRR